MRVKHEGYWKQDIPIRATKMICTPNAIDYATAWYQRPVLQMKQKIGGVPLNVITIYLLGQNQFQPLYKTTATFLYKNVHIFER